jgi:hypothetical protein
VFARYPRIRPFPMLREKTGEDLSAPEKRGASAEP